jgi:hypothetical protein
LRDHDVPVDELAAVNDAQDVKAYDVICVQPTQLRQNLQREAIKNYLSGGGGLLMADLGWGWQQLNPGKNLSADHPGNQLLADAGIVWADGYLKKSDQEDFAVEGPPSALTHAGVAIDAVVAQDAGPSSLSDSDVRQAVAVASRAVRSIPSHDSLLLPKLAALEKRHARFLVPTAHNSNRRDYGPSCGVRVSGRSQRPRRSGATHDRNRHACSPMAQHGALRRAGKGRAYPCSGRSRQEEAVGSNRGP